MNYGGFILGCITVILILLIVCAFIYPNTIYDSSIILLTAISSIAWIIVYMSTRTLRCIQNDNPKELICKIGGNGRKYKIKGGIKGENYNTITGGLVLNKNKKILINNLISAIMEKNKNKIDDYVFKLGWKFCGNQLDAVEFLQRIVGIKNNDNPVEIDGEVIYTYEITNDKTHDYYFNDTNFVLTLPMYEKTPIIPYFKKLIKDQHNDLGNKVNIDNFPDCIGFIIHLSSTNTGEGGHYIAVVQYKNTWIICDDSREIYTFRFKNEDFTSQDFLTILEKRGYNHNFRKIRYMVFGKSLKPLPNTDLKLDNVGNTCYANSVLQILRATTLLDDTDNGTANQNKQQQAPTTPAETSISISSIKAPAPIPISVQQPAPTPASTQVKTKSLIGIIYTPKGEFNNHSEQNYADYENIMKPDIYKNITKPTLVIYNENFEQYKDYQDINRGRGNAVIRPLRSDAQNRTVNTANLYVLGIPISSHYANFQQNARTNNYSTPIDNIRKLIEEKNIEVVIFGMSKDEFTLGIDIFNNPTKFPDAIGNRNYYFNMLIERLGNDFQKFYFANNDNTYNLTYKDENVPKLLSLQKLIAPTTTTTTPTPVQQNKPQPQQQPQAPAKTPAQQNIKDTLENKNNWEKLQKEDQPQSKSNIDLPDNSTENSKPKDYDVYKQNLEESKKNETKMKEVELNQQDLDKINKWTDIINSNTVIKTDLKTQLIKYLNDNIKKEDVLKNIIDKLYNEYTIQNNDNYDKKRKYDEDKNPNLDLYKYYYDICKQYKTFLNNIQKINRDEYKRLNDIYTNKITEDNNNNIIEDDNIKTSYKKMLDTPIFTLINDYTDYMEIPFYNRMIENSNLNIKDKNGNYRYDIQNLLPLNLITLIYVFKKHKIAEKLNNFKLVYKLIEWSSILDRTTLDSLNNNDEGDELAEEENNDNLANFENGIVDDDTLNQSIYYIQRTPIRDLIKTKLLTPLLMNMRVSLKRK